MARRLVEAGVALVTVNWHDDGQNFWDTHGNNFEPAQERPDAPGRPRLRRPAGRPGRRGACSTRRWSSGSASSAGRRGSTGPTPAASTGRAATRPSWPAAGVRGGIVHGASDRWAAYPALDPVSPEDLGATILHALGIDPAGESSTPGRPLRLSTGDPLMSLFG